VPVMASTMAGDFREHHVPGDAGPTAGRTA
jgi:hypothetical protein